MIIENGHSGTGTEGGHSRIRIIEVRRARWNFLVCGGRGKDRER